MSNLQTLNDRIKRSYENVKFDCVRRPTFFHLMLPENANKIVFVRSGLVPFVSLSHFRRVLPSISTSLKHSRYHAQSRKLSNGIFNTFASLASRSSHSLEEQKHSKSKARRDTSEVLQNKKSSLVVGNTTTDRIIASLVSLLPLTRSSILTLSLVEASNRSCIVVGAIHAKRVRR